MLLLSVPIFFSTLIFVGLPPLGHYALYKLVISLVSIILTSPMAIRINDKLLIDIIRLLYSYALRPHIYLYRCQLKDATFEPIQNINNQNINPQTIKAPIVNLSSIDRAKGHRIFFEKSYRVLFINKRGRLNVKVESI